MKIEVPTKTKDEIEIVIYDEEETILPPLRRKLLEDKMVTHANYTIVHPLLDPPRLYVRVVDGKPQNAIKRACKALASGYEALRDDLKAQMREMGIE